MEDQRRHSRTASTALVELVHPALGRIEVKARDLSDGGIFVLIGQHVAPPIGTVLQVRIKRFTGAINRDPVAMRVVHHQSGGVGLAFV
ncbi:MAG: PilZ domain-containing protein [Spongiibacteraceae bacterium]